VAQQPLPFFPVTYHLQVYEDTTLLLNIVLGTSIFSLAQAQRRVLQRINIDGSFSDWAGVPPPSSMMWIQPARLICARSIGERRAVLYVRVKLETTGIMERSFSDRH